MPHIDEAQAVDLEAKELWRPSSPESTQIHDFMTKVNKKYGLSLNDYNSLWQWSVSEPAQFWEQIWHYTHINAHKPYQKVKSYSTRFGLDPLAMFDADLTSRYWTQQTCCFPDLLSSKEAN